MFRATKQPGKRLIPLLILCLLAAAGIYSAWNALSRSKQRYKAGLAAALENRGDDIRRFHQASSGNLIAHGGGVGPYLYTNSAEAFADSQARGFSFVEFDLLVTADRHLLAAHDWDMFCQFTGSRGTPGTLDSALQLKINGNQTPLSGRMIHELMLQHPEMVLVTDKVSDFELLLQEIPLPQRMIVEVFSPQDYVRALKAGIWYPAFCISHSIALQQAIEHQYPIITISAGLYMEHLDTMRQLHQQKVCIMVYGTEELDCRQFIREHLGTSASLIYTSTVSPSDLP
ncbi:MAG: glycerophosphodiester phosphodiesterase family protein [Akkermansia sp.]|nr:glycerophosphodiester phosphodiesterase family protein [Akkermansia sp.]